MENVAPSGALARRSRQWLQLAFVLVTGGVFIGIIGIALFVIPLAVPANQIYGLYHFIRTLLLLAGGILALTGVGLAVRAYFTRIDNDLALRTGRYLAPLFDERFWFVRNVNKRNLGYIDAVLVGPPGVLVFRIVDLEGVYANEKGNWLKRNRQGEWVPSRVNPTAEDIVDIKAMREYLDQNRVPDIPVYGIVVFTKAAPLVEVVAKEPTVPVAQLKDIMVVLQDNYLARDRISQPAVERVVDLIYDH